MTKKELYAYLAGILDGESYIGIKKSTWGMRNRDDVHSPTYSERIQIRMCSPGILQLFKDEFGGSFSREPKVYQSKSGFPSKKIMYCYGATDKVAVAIIKACLPYLIEKRPQALLCLDLRKTKESKKAYLRGGMKQRRLMDDSIISLRESLYQAVKTLHE